jgi:hypothetical protein
VNKKLKYSLSCNAQCISVWTRTWNV